MRRTFIRSSYILWLYSLGSCQAQLPCLCSIIELKDTFALESTQELWSADDMIFRRPALYRVVDDSLDQRSIYIFENGVFVPEACRNTEFVHLINHSSSLLNDSMHTILESKSAVNLQVNGNLYKALNLSFRAMYLGQQLIWVNPSTDTSRRLVATYLVLDFDY